MPTVASNTKSKKNAKQEAAENILTLLRGKLLLFLTPLGAMWAAVPLSDDRREVYPLYSAAVTEWLQGQYNAYYKGVVSKFDIEPCLATQAGLVRYHAMTGTHDVVSRMGSGHERSYDPHSPQEVYLDLCDSEGRVVKVTRSGWKVVRGADDEDGKDGVGEVFFQHTPGMLPLPVPVKGGSLAELRQFMNCPTNLADPVLQARSDRNWRTILAWLIGTLMPKLDHTGSYAHLAFFCAKGTGKSTVAQMLCDLVDPNKAGLHQRPESPEDILRKASKSHIVAFDNLTSLPTQISDALCQLSTGLSDSKRRLYTNDDEIIYSVKGPAILNGTSDLVRQADLAERTLRVELTPISPEHRQDEERLWAAFREAQPRILGALLDTAVAALAHKAEVAQDLKEKPRHADLAIWLAASEFALERQEGLGWQRGTFADVLRVNRKEMGNQALANNAVVTQLLQFLRERPIEIDGSHIYDGTFGDLFTALSIQARECGLALNNPYVNWPATPQRLYEVLRRDQTELAERGLTVSEPRRDGHDRKRLRRFIYRKPDAKDGDDDDQMAAAA